MIRRRTRVRAAVMSSAAAAKLTVYVCPKLAAAIELTTRFIENIRGAIGELEARRGSLSEATLEVERRAYTSLLSTANTLVEDTTRIYEMLCSEANPTQYTLYRAAHMLSRILSRLRYGHSPRLPAHIVALLHEANKHLAEAAHGGGSVA